MSEKNENIAGKIKEIKFKDPVFDKDFSVNVTELFTTITIGKRSYYFNPDGTFDGTGHDCH